MGRALSTVGVLLLQFALVVPALAAGGDLDPSFGIRGQVTSTVFSSDGGGNPIAFQADGKILVAGSVPRNPDWTWWRFAVARFDVDGNLDPTFGGDGIVRTIFRAGTKCRDEAVSLVVQSDQKIVAVGTSSCERTEPGAGEADSLFASARYDADGTLDATFGDNGTVLTSFGDPARCNAQATAAALEPDGRIVAAGTAGCVEAGLDSRFAVARYDTDGALDTSFSDDGLVRTNFTPQFDKLTDVAVQPDGRIVAGGTAAYWMVEIPDALESRAALARYDLDGTLDTTFGGDGKVTTSFHSRLCGGSNESYGLAIQPDGKIVEGGSAGCAASIGGLPHPRWALARYRPNGRLDPTFGRGGRVVSIFLAEEGADWMSGGIAIQPNGKIVAAGSTGRMNPHFTLARYRANGTLGREFGDDGVVRTVFDCSHPGGGSGSWNGLAIQADRKIVATGGGGCLRSFVMARFLPS